MAVESKLIMPSRRGLLKGLAGILAVGVAPSIVRASSIMPVKPIKPAPEAWAIYPWQHGDKIWFLRGNWQTIGGQDLFITIDGKRVLEDFIQDIRLAT